MVSVSSTPGGGDSDDDLEIGHAPLSAADCKEQKKAKRLGGVAIPLESDEDEITSIFTLGQPSQMRRRKKLRKGAARARVVISDSERDDDDVPDSPVTSGSVDGDDISINFTRLQKLADIEGNKVSDEMEGDDLDGFIVNDMSEHDSSLSGGGSDESASVSDEIISGFRREWEYEADMLADFGKSDELCMKAVCVLYRQQTSEEKSYKSTINRNGRGFSQFHASSGTALAEFLIDGDSHGEMNKTVEELGKFNPYGVEECHKLASHYSKQLFEIYKNEEDTSFHPLYEFDII